MFYLCLLQLKILINYHKSLSFDNNSYPLPVVYFDLRMCAAHSKCWAKTDFQCKFAVFTPYCTWQRDFPYDFFSGNKILDQPLVANSKEHIFPLILPKFFAFSSFSAFQSKNLETQIWTRVWSAQHPNAGQNIQHLSHTHTLSIFPSFIHPLPLTCGLKNVAVI